MAQRDYENRRSNGQLLHLKKAQERNFQVQTVPHTFSRDGLVRFGDNVMLSIGNDKDARYLSSNVFMKSGLSGSRVTAGSTAAPQARTVFVLVRPGSHPSEVLSASSARDEDVLLYGDRVVVACSPYLVADPSTGSVGMPLVLSSAKASIALGNTRKGMQEVVMSPARSADAEWLVTHATVDRLLADGTPVRAGDEVVLTHSMSNVPLAACKAEGYPTDFGAELEVHGMAYKGTTRSSMNADGIMAAPPSQPENRWKFVHAGSPEAEHPLHVRKLEPLSPESLVRKARSLMARNLGPHGVRSFALALSALDARGSGFVARDAAKLALYDHGAALSEEEFTLLFSYFTGSTTLARSAAANLLPRQQLLDAIRGGEGLSDSRIDMVHEAYTYLCSTSPDGTLTAGHAKGKFDGKWDPRVQASSAPGAPKYGGMTAVEAKAEFGRQWPRHVRAADAITPAQFGEYYTDVSACVEDEWEFSQYVANSWHLPGKGGWKGKAGKKVHVDFFNGSSTDAVIPGGEDIRDEDFEGLVEALGRMGMGGIARCKVLGLVHDE